MKDWIMFLEYLDFFLSPRPSGSSSSLRDADTGAPAFARLRAVPPARPNKKTEHGGRTPRLLLYARLFTQFLPNNLMFHYLRRLCQAQPKGAFARPL